MTITDSKIKALVSHLRQLAEGEVKPQRTYVGICAWLADHTERNTEFHDDIISGVFTFRE